jgi:hypothetical protein
MAALRGDIGFWYLKQFFLHVVQIKLVCLLDLIRDKNVMARTRKYYLKNNYLTLRSKVKVP